MGKPRKRVAVIMQRRAVDNQWQSEVWEPVGVLADYEGEVELGSAAAKVVGLAEVPVTLVK